MTTYNYTRVKNAGAGYDVENENRTDANGQIYLAKEIETALPGKTFKVKCDDTVLDILFDTALTSGQKTTLDGVVNDHKNNT